MPPKSICLVAGEPSGDTQGALLVAELKRRHPDWDLWGVGLSRMASVGCDLWQDASDWAVMGFAEVLGAIVKFKRRLSGLTKEIERRKPGALILIDYPGFNLKLAPQVHKLGIPVFYYIVPQIWAWGKGRIKTFQRSVDRAICLFPFEEEFFSRHGVKTHWIGHPLVDSVRASADRETLRALFGIKPGHRFIALMPGVRPQDFQAHLPLFCDALRLITKSIPDVHASIAINPKLQAQMPALSKGYEDLYTTTDVYELLTAADLVLTKTGTTTVETAICGTPMITAYRTGRLNFAIAKALVDIPFIAMPNLIANRRIVPEYIQSAATPRALAAEAITLLTDEKAREDQRRGLAEVKEKLGPPGAVQRGAVLIEEWLSD